jgi:ParB-like chromosome segregation protein Spo0J
MREDERRDAAIWVPLAQIRISERRRRAISEATVERYRDWLEQGREAPPVRLERHGDAFVVRDGRHRVAAALAAGHLHIEALVRRLRQLVEMARAILASSALPGDEALSGERLACNEEGAGSTPAVSTLASVVSTASTRPLYGRGAGSTPAGGFTRP